VRSAPLGTPRTASSIRISGCRRRAGARHLLAGDDTFEDGLGIIHYCRLGYLMRVVCDEGGRARSRATVLGTIFSAVPLRYVSKGFALTWYRALTWYSSPARPFAAPEVSQLVTGQQGSPSPACRQLSRAQNACAESSHKESTKLGHATKLGRTLC